MKRLLLVLLLYPACYAVNDFSGDPNCVSLFRMENGALTADSIGSNTLTQYGTVTADTVNYMEGAASADFNYSSSGALYRTDTNLSADFPGKDGAANNVFSFPAWFRVDVDHGTFMCICAKYDPTQSKYTYMVGCNVTVDYVQLTIGDGAANVENYTIASAGLAVGTWYHILATYDGATKNWTLRLYNDGDKTTKSNSGTGSLAIGYSSVPNFVVGRADGATSYRLDGKIDELVIFDDIISAAEDDQIIAGTYGAAAGGAAQIF